MLSDETYLKILKGNQSLKGSILKENIPEIDNPILEIYLESVQYVELDLMVEDLKQMLEKPLLDTSKALPPGGDISDLGDQLSKTLSNLTTTQQVIAGSAAALAIIYASYKISKGIRQHLKPKKCRQYKLNSPAQKKCHHQVDIAALEKQVQILKSKIKLCAHSKDKQKCEMKIKKKVAELQHKVVVKKAKITEIEKQLAAMLKVKR
ncbi:MAG: hypothetical protein KGD64_04015 [Candidatus Heimdallarchaeota archaeon]|nr:hypothetical protein [Candidatus Heimdallarchaeota archaeon]